MKVVQIQATTDHLTPTFREHEHAPSSSCMDSKSSDESFRPRVSSLNAAANALSY